MLNNYNKIIRLNIFVAIAILLFFHSVLNAQTPAEAQTKVQAEDGNKQKLDSYLRFMPSREVEAMSGKVEIMESACEYSYEFKAFDKLPVKFSLENNYISIENSTSVELPGHLVGLSTDIETTLPFFNIDKTYLCAGLKPSFYSDDWDFPASSFRIPVRSFLIYLPNTRWTFLCGVAVYPDFETKVLPILGFIYKPNDKLTFNIISKRPNISYSFNDRVTLFTEGGNSFSEFEVAKDNLKNVVLRYSQMHLGLGIKYKVNQFIQGSIQAGGVFNRSLKYKDSLGKLNLRDGAYTELRIEIEI